MPLLIVPSHHDSPKSLENTFKRGYLKSQPSIKTFSDEKSIGSWIVIASQQALEKILTKPEDSFDWFNYDREEQVLSTNYINADDRKFSEILLDNKDPACQKFWTWWSRWYSSISLVKNDSDYSDCMRALIEIMWDLPIVSVLQAYVFDPKNYDTLDVWNNYEKDLTQDMLTKNYPFWMLAYPKRVWPQFYHALTWESILTISHHPDEDNSPHYSAFHSDPRLWNIEEWDNIDTIREKIKNALMPIILKKIKKINKTHIRV